MIPPVGDDTVTALTEGFQALMWHLIVTHPALVQCTPEVGVADRMSEARATRRA